MRKFKNALLLFLLVTMSAILFACNNDENASNNGAESSSETDTENSSTNNEPQEISMMFNLHVPEVPDKRLEEMLEEATNTKLDIRWVPDNNYAENLNTAIATNNLPDVFLLKDVTLDQQKEAVRDGQYWEIGPYLEEFPNLSKLNPDILKNTSIDGKIYTLYAGRPLSRQGLIYRKDWADNLGLDTPTNLDELYEMMRAFTEDDPDGNGKDDTIGLTDREILGTFENFATWHGAPNNWGEKDGELLPQFMFPEYREAMDYFKSLFDNGYINKDAPVTSKTDQQELLKNGTAGVYIGTMGDVEGMYKDAVAINPDVVLDVHNYIEGPDGEYRTRSIPGYGSMLIFPKAAIEDEEELRGVLSFFDYLMSPEGSNLLIWGVEGEHHEVIDGKAQVIEENKEKFDREILPYTPLEIGEPATNGRYTGHFEYEPRAKAEELYEDNNNYLVADPTAALDSATWANTSETLTQIMEDATYQYFLGQIDSDGFDQAIEKWKEAGGAQVIEEYNEQWKAQQ
ncbi:carbohydrate ABC transporter substrate-binding protein, CUT1 family (TC 3.A.1.1.-) [Gracilibacillus ureilyticus]|uniref:Carbohydrate ABC transporter substrate-binding protein, CUT1 family (TC 3.A.1.1.-) n=1 Tax=Gracilibacillus ureilyticus TaxID=531814 RepID=A0A1H9Q7I9_9BACI|nr:extracellular solute-binding protein [Gracilibacillus ureilyticus]SER56404.1 carbohydrate ABC transporter substrate-binding protein, CUT1 family (TC 3.A.1.1.-) [Gracilibacillus ureilyticus]